MFIRTTQQLMVNSAIDYARQHSLALARLQQQVSTGLRINRPSDDPGSVRAAISHDFTDQELEGYLSNISAARNRLNVSVTQLQAAKDVFVEARSIAFDSRQTTDREALVAQLDRLIDRLHNIANDRFEGNYLFSGNAVQTRPFEFDGAGNQGEYLGSSQHTQVTIGAELSADVLWSGAGVFQPRHRQGTIYLGNTGAAAGSGTDSGLGFGTLAVRHVATTYAGGSGVAPGTSSPGGDSVIGPTGSHRLTIDAVGRTISLNGGNPVDYTGTESDLKITGATGEVVYVDVTSIVPSFQGDVSINATGALSMDGGASEVAIDFSTNQMLVHSSTETVTFVDSSNIRRSGVAHLEYSGTTDAFGALEELRLDLLNERGLKESAWQDSITRRVDELDRIANHLLDIVGQQSATLANLDSVQIHHEDLQLETRRILGDLTSADLAEVITQLQARQNLLQTTYATTVTILNSSLVNFIR
jgi:flagellar hook-associated protein 3